MSLYTAVTALQSHQQFMDVVANNLANVNTVGYKASRALFADALSQTLKTPTAASATTLGGNGAQIGMGVSVSSVTPNFTQGALQSTGLPSDLSIQGDGFFVVADPITATTAYTRAGSFTVDLNGYITTPTGQRVQGGAPGAVNGDALVDMQIPAAVGAVPVTGFNIDQNGQVIALLQDGTTSVVGAITMEKFTNTQGLVKVGDNLYMSTPAAGPNFASYHAPGQDGLGSMRAGYLELSNVDLGQEFSDMIRAQRGLQANARVITTSDQIMEELINLKR